MADVTIHTRGVSRDDPNPRIEIILPAEDDLPERSLTYVFTDEGVIIDAFEDGEPLATYSITYPETIEGMSA